MGIFSGKILELPCFFDGIIAHMFSGIVGKPLATGVLTQSGKGSKMFFVRHEMSTFRLVDSVRRRLSWRSNNECPSS
jgi:hypothetical protein